MSQISVPPGLWFPGEDDDPRVWDLVTGTAAFDPRQVTEVAEGYFWDPTAATGGGGAGFLLPEGNGLALHNLVTPAAGTAPAIGALNGQAIITYANGSPDKISRTNTVVDRGFNGATMIFGWFNAASAPGSLFGHGRGATPVFYLQLAAGSMRVGVDDGGGIDESAFPLPPGGYAAGPFYYEALFVPSEGTATNRIQLTIDRVAQTPTIAASAGTTMSDPSDFFQMGCGSSSDSSTFNISADWSHGVVGITNGIPSAANRDALFNYRKLK